MRLAVVMMVGCVGKAPDTLPSSTATTRGSETSTPSSQSTSTSTTSTPSGSDGTTPTSSTPDSTAPVDDSAQQLCVDTINAYRATLGLAAYGRWTSAETCVDGQAHDDYVSNTPHSAFGNCGEWAQNECPGWPSPPDGMIEDCLAAMWAEGPGTFDQHGHYVNMSNPGYTLVACGFYTTPQGDVWATQDFQ